jgi:hypothetical protein
MRVRAATWGRLFLAITAAVYSAAPMLVSAATTEQCLTMADDLLAAKKGKNDDRAMDVSTKIVSECHSLGIASIAQHFHDIGQDGLALGAADACVQRYPQEELCWATKAAQHVHQRQAKEAEDAYKQALTLVNDPSEKQKIQDLLESLHRIRRREEIFVH